MSRPFLGTITTAANSNAQRLSDLVKAVIGSGGDSRASTRYCELYIRNDDAQADMFIGNAGVTTTTNYTYHLVAGASVVLGAGNQINNICLENYWVRYASNSQKFNFGGRIA